MERTIGQTHTYRQALIREAGEGSAAVVQDGEDDWTDAEDVAGGTDRTAEQVCFTYGGGSDDHAPRTSVITDDVAGGAQGSATRRPQVGRGRGAIDRGGPPRARRVLGVDSSDKDEGEAHGAEQLRDRRFHPSHHCREQPEQLRRSHRLAERSGPTSHQPQDIPPIPVVEGTPSHSGLAQAATSVLRTSDFDIAGSHGGSPILRCGVGDRAEYKTDGGEREETVEERDARLDREEEAWLQSMPRWAGRDAYEAEQRRQRELEMIGAGSQASVRPLPTTDTMQPASHAEGGGAERCGLNAGGGVQTDAIVHDVVVGICAAAGDGGIHGGEEEMVDEASVPLPSDAAQVEEELVDEGCVPLEVEGSVPFVAFDDDTAQVEEEGAAVHACHSAPSLRDGETGGHVQEDGATVDMFLAIIVRPPSVRDVETGGHIDSGRPDSSSAGGYFGEMPRWDGGKPGECTPTPLRPEQLERMGTEDPFPYTGLPPTGGRGSGWGFSSSHRGGVSGGWSSYTRVTNSLRRDYDRGQGLFAHGPSREGGPASGASDVGRPSVHTTGRILGLDRLRTRTTEPGDVHLARSAMEDRRQGLPYTSGEDDLHMPQGSRRHGSINDIDAEIAVEERRLAELIRERERRSETKAQAEEADTETEPIKKAVRRERHRRAAAAAGSHLAPVGRDRAPQGRGQSGQRGAWPGRGSGARHGTHQARWQEIGTC
ncbi:hypothetical protein CBR_g22096 [Chara braunii]|uniref:Uncharacterized protein n=1 Tax=Chara braunii TaxID=69332 RepID=A0A388L230_CHABU|nr:hypothetical protein CBR_g22096 [Chara braunii]|eukprot:GBG76349.1 hypothetical protein CBR_g22096 [Chara braunii]